MLRPNGRRCNLRWGPASCPRSPRPHPHRTTRALQRPEPPGQADAGRDGRRADVPGRLLRAAAHDPVHRAVVHQLERHRASQLHRVHGHPATTRRCSPSTRRSGRRSPTTSSGWAGSCSSRRHWACSWRCCSTRTSAAPASTRAPCICPWCCRWPSSGSSGSCSTRRPGVSSTGCSGTNQQGNIIDWLGNKDINLWAVLIAASWRQVGYVMILYLAGLKAFDPSLREAAADRRRQRAADVLPGRVPGPEARSTS